MNNTDFGDWGKDDGSGSRNDDDQREQRQPVGHPPPNQNGAIGPRNPVSAPDNSNTNTWGNNEASNNGPSNHSVGYQRRNVDNNDWDRSNQNTNPGMLKHLLIF